MNMIKKGIAIILLLGILGGTVFVFSRLTNNFKNFDKETISKNGKEFFDKKVKPEVSKKVGFKALSTESLEEIDFNNPNVDLSKGVTFATNMNLSEGETSEYVPTFFNFNVNIEPSNATINTFELKVKFKNAESDWASGKNISDYVESNVEGNKVTITCKQPFGEVVQIIVVSEDNEIFKSVINCDFLAEQQIIGLCDELTNNFDVEKVGNDYVLIYRESNLKVRPEQTKILKIEKNNLFKYSSTVGTIVKQKNVNNVIKYDLGFYNNHQAAFQPLYLHLQLLQKLENIGEYSNKNVSTILAAFPFKAFQKSVKENVQNNYSNLTYKIQVNENEFVNLIFKINYISVNSLKTTETNHVFK